MTCCTHSTTAVILSLLFFLCAYESKAQPHVTVISDQATIYTEPDTGSPHQLNTEEGEFFQLEEVKEEWVKINLFSGSPWYIKRSAVEPAYIIPPYPSEPTIRKAVCKQTIRIKRNASEEAISEFPDNITRQRSYEHFLIDKQLLSVFREFGIPASQSSKLLECAVDGIIPD